MQNPFGLMGRALAIGALLAFAGTSSIAQTGPRETSLLGVTLLKSSFRDVLRLYGRPSEIQAGGPFIPTQGIAVATASGGAMMGMAGPGGPSGSGKKSINKTGFPGRGSTGSSAPSGGGMAASGGGMPGYPGMGGGGLPGFGGGSPMMGSSGTEYPGLTGGSGGGQSAMGNSGGGADAGSEQPEYESTWWYHDMKNGLHKSFLFNKDGRVIQVQEYGYDKNHKGSRTRRGVGLGSDLNSVLRTYGWSNDGSNEGTNLIMRYGGEDKVAFQLVKNKVVGITIAIVKEVPQTEAQ